MSKLENFKYIDDLKIKNKYEITNLIEPGNILDTYYRNTLKDFTPDKATFAYEENRRNTDSVGKLNTHYYGRRNTTEPFQNDLFLGFTDKDPRSIHDGPLMGKYQEQIWKRKDDYKYSFKDDSDNSIHTAGISESKMQTNKKKHMMDLKIDIKILKNLMMHGLIHLMQLNQTNQKYFYMMLMIQYLIYLM